VLSTTLWHPKKEVELSDLAQRAVDFDRMASEAWFVVGRYGQTFFHRSIQLDPTYTYAHANRGHEYMSNEDFDKAISCYHDAIRFDARHKNAWHGLGGITSSVLWRSIRRVQCRTVIWGWRSIITARRLTL